MTDDEPKKEFSGLQLVRNIRRINKTVTFLQGDTTTYFLINQKHTFVLQS